ncbi:hypothetical protein BH11BAC7_BH11BAC7_30610 [soil metagenome]
MWKSIRQGNTWQGEIMNKSKDGIHYRVDAVIIPMKDERGDITSYISLMTLIADERKTGR